MNSIDILVTSNSFLQTLDQYLLFQMIQRFTISYQIHT